jgi:NAD(P)-dependent dehydrogenase (short-subunit alcohol dehydrogenase family)
MADARRAVVTAGAGGIGLEIARVLARDGFDVVIGDIDAHAGERAAAELGATFGHLDAADERSVREFFAGAGAVHALVNNVGIRGATGGIDEIPIDDFRATFEVNTFSHVLASQLVIPGMKAAGAGVIVNIASMAARTGAVGRAPYGMSKWALLGLTKSLANELAPWDIRANAVLPGAVRGERFDGSIALHAQAEGITQEAALERIMGRQRIKRHQDPSEIAEAVAYLVSAAAVSVTGVFLEVAGGFE